MIETLAPTDEHLQYIARTMRPADLAEVMATGVHDNPLSALRKSVAFSPHSAVFVANGVPLCVFGVAPVSFIAGTGAPWLLASVAIEQHIRPLLPRVIPYIHAMLSIYPSLRNHVHAENRKAIRFLRSVGFEIHPAHEVGLHGALFHPFTMEKRDV